MKQSDLKVLVDIRERLLEVNYDDPSADALTPIIHNSLIKNFDEYTTEFILETYTRLGGDINIIYDDNGNWAADYVKFSPVNLDGNVERNFDINRNKFFPTVREAIYKFLTEDDEQEG